MLAHVRRIWVTWLKTYTYAATLAYGGIYRERAEPHCINKHHSRSINVWRNTIYHHPASLPSEKAVERKGKEVGWREV